SRFENAVGRTDLYRLGTAVADAVLIYHRERLGEGVRLITIDLDATDDPTHGQQEFALFNGYYDTWCYLPLIATMTFDTEPLQHIVAALLRPGTGAPTRGVRGLLRRLFTKLHALFPRARLRVRTDAGFVDAKLLAFLDAADVEEVRGLAGNRRRTALLRPRRYGESAQGAAAKPGPGPDQLLALHRQPAPRASLRRGLRPVPDAAGLRARHCARVGSGVDAARTTGEDRGLG